MWFQICETAVPTALQMANATRHNAEQRQPQLCAFQLDSQHSRSLSAACEERPRLQRELTAFQSIQDDLVDESTAAVLLSLDWSKLRDATVVEVCVDRDARVVWIVLTAEGRRQVHLRGMCAG